MDHSKKVYTDDSDLECSAYIVDLPEDPISAGSNSIGFHSEHKTFTITILDHKLILISGELSTEHLRAGPPSSCVDLIQTLL